MEQIYNNMQEIRIMAKSEPKTKIDFQPKNDEEKAHLLRLRELLGVKRKGDWLLVGQMLNISSKNAEQSFARVYSKNHNKVVSALDKVIETRIKLLKKPF